MKLWELFQNVQLNVISQNDSHTSGPLRPTQLQVGPWLVTGVDYKKWPSVLHLPAFTPLQRGAPATSTKR